MNFKGAVTINAPRDKVWHFLTTPAELTHCAPGAWNGSSCSSAEDEGVAVVSKVAGIIGVATRLGGGDLKEEPIGRGQSRRAGVPRDGDVERCVR